MNYLFFSWNVAMCTTKLLFSPKLALHISHLNGLYSSWKVLMCPFMSCLDVKSVLQMSHLKTFFPSWTVATCFFQIVLCCKVDITNFTFALLFSYLYCTKICLFKLLLHLKSLLQISHMYFFILSWTDASWNSKAVFPPKLEAFAFWNQFCSFSSRLTTPPNLCLISFKITWALANIYY